MSLYVYLGIAIAFMVALAGAGYKGFELGSDSVTAKWQAQALKEATENAAKLKAVSDAYRQKEQENARQSQLVSRRYQKEIANAETAKIAALDNLRTGALRLRDPNAKPDTCGDSTAKTGSGTGGHNGRAAGGLPEAPAGVLSDAASQFLIAEASRADAIVAQLQGCQAIVRADRN